MEVKELTIKVTLFDEQINKVKEVANLMQNLNLLNCIGDEAETKALELMFLCGGKSHFEKMYENIKLNIDENYRKEIFGKLIDKCNEIIDM